MMIRTRHVRFKLISFNKTLVKSAICFIIIKRINKTRYTVHKCIPICAQNITKLLLVWQ